MTKRFRRNGENMDILNEAKKNFDYMVRIRRHMHEYPENSGVEYETVKYIASELDALGIEYVVVPEGGIIGQIHGGKPGKTVLLRADMDALPIKESKTNLTKEKVCISKNDGISHACGHDAHTAMLLAEAKILNENKEDLNGNIVLLFERGEEAGGNIRNLLPYAVETMKLKIDTCMATHVKWDVPTGTISAEPGAVFSGAYGFIIKLHGQAGHGSRPDLAHSVLDCFNNIYNHINMIRMKYVAPTDILTCSVGFVNCGTVRNIIPDELTFGGTIRTFNVDGAGAPFVKQMMDVVEKECELCQCTYEILHMPDPLFECQNNAVCSEIAKNAVRKYIGEDAVTVAQPWMASESMQACLKLWPGIITFTGIQSEEAGTGANHHTPEFDVDERGMIYGVAAALGYVKDFLNYDKGIPFKPFAGTLKNLVERNL